MARVTFESVAESLAEIIPSTVKKLTVAQLARYVSQATNMTEDAARQWLYGYTTGKRAKHEVLAELLEFEVEAGQRGRRIDLDALRQKIAAKRKKK